MKIALYIEDGVEQIVLTPQTETEKAILGKLADGRRLSIYQGSFYECNGGWYRHDRDSDSSTIIRLREPEKGHPEPGADAEPSVGR